MKKSRMRIESSAVGENISVVLWECENPKGVVQIVHGMSEHIERYDDFASFLTDNGYCVIGHDHLGHGSTMRDAKHEGFFAEANGWDRLVEDVKRVHDAAEEKFGKLPYIIFGHSMGSFVARTYASRCGDANAFVFSGTAGRNPALAIAKILVKSQIRKHGLYAKGDFLNGMAFGSYCKRIKDSKSPYAWLSRDREAVEKYENDPLCGFVFTNAGFRDLFDGIGEISEKGWAGKVPNVPILLIAGADDPVGSYGKGVKEVADRLRNTGHDVTLKLYDKARHEVLNEINRQEVFTDVLNFIEGVS